MRRSRWPATQRRCAWLDEQSIEHEGECQLRRVVGADGRGRAYLNGLTVPVQSLRALGELLVDVHGQLEFQSLSRRGYQRETLDGSGQLTARNAAVRTAHAAWQALDEQRASFEQRVRERESRLDLLRHFVTELQALDPRPGEAEAVIEERKRISSLGRLAEGTAQVEALLAGDDGGVTSALARSQGVLRQLAGLDAALEPMATQLEEATIAAREALSSLRRYTDALDADPARQEWIEARLAALEAVARKHRVETRELPALRDALAAELAGARGGRSQRIGIAATTRGGSRALPCRRETPHPGAAAGGDRTGPQGHGLHAGARHAGRRLRHARRAAGSAGVLGAR